MMIPMILMTPDLTSLIPTRYIGRREWCRNRRDQSEGDSNRSSSTRNYIELHSQLSLRTTQHKQTMELLITLACPDFTKPFDITTNASRTTIGSVLCQNDKLIAFFITDPSHRVDDKGDRPCLNTFPLLKLPANPVEHPLFQTMPTELVDFKAMISFRKPLKYTSEELLNEENFYLTIEEGDQGLLHVLILSMKERTQSKRPVVVYLHPTNANIEHLRPLLEDYASRGYIAIAIDSRYHGERAKMKQTIFPSHRRKLRQTNKKQSAPPPSLSLMFPKTPRSSLENIYPFVS
ncbi:unnamed protein product [Lactuca saligna]|uniref:Uncharacterized protein n=1 Tax=Lactuca saligna TaxID=75948 RepID=A0AA35ZW15_LACSI|nr:unnamed protein product [Lactuca saligna]